MISLLNPVLYENTAYKWNEIIILLSNKNDRSLFVNKKQKYKYFDIFAMWPSKIIHRKLNLCSHMIYYEQNGFNKTFQNRKWLISNQSLPDYGLSHP